SRNEMSAYEYEYQLAKSDSVSFYFLTAPKRILGNGHVAAVECIKMKISTPDAKGRRKPVPIPNSELQIPVDMVIKSVGQNIARSFLSSIPDLRTDHDRVWVHPDTFQTSNPNLFAGGDCINGGKEVVNGAAHGKKAAHAIDKYLFSK
ncbi:MAG: FAD-dependent oxidoreductase, partial [Bacteroidota bacterium]